MKQWWSGVSRRKKVLLYLLAILIMSFLVYLFLGAPPLNWQHRYRRIEKAYFVGPGQILGHEKISGSFYDETVLARTEEGVIITSIMSQFDYGEMLFYLPMTGKLIVTAAPQMLAPIDIDFKEDTLTVFVVDDYPEAVRAELDLQLFWRQQPEDEGERPIYHLSAPREKEGYFRLDAPFESLDENSVERKALELFSEYTRNVGWREARWLMPEDVCKATVRLYDEQNNVVLAETISLFS